MNARHALQLFGFAEVLTLAVLLTNLATVHVPEIARLMGPVHGLAYLVTIITAILAANGHHRVWLLALIPAAGGLLAAARLNRRNSALDSQTTPMAQP